MDIFSLITAYGPVPGGILLALLLLWYFRRPAYKFLTARLAQYRKAYPLSYHTFFLRMDAWMRYDIKHIPFTDPFRRAVFSDFLRIKFECCRDILMSYVMDKKAWEKRHPNELKDELITLVMDCVVEYEERAKLNGIPDLIVEKFNYWHQSRVKIVVEGIKAICSSQFYVSNTSRLAAILDLFTVAFHDTILDGERTLQSLNGDLDRMEYHGHVCPLHNED